MPIVKTIVIRMSVVGADEAKRQVTDVGDAVKRLEDQATIPVKLTGVEEMRAQMAELRMDLARLADPIKIKINLDSDVLAQVTRLRLELAALSDLGGGAGGLAGAAGAAGAAGGPAGGLGLAGGLTAAGIALLPTGIFGIIPAIVAAGVALASFGALAYGTFSKIITAVGKTKDAMDGLTPAQQHVVTGIKSLQTEFGKMGQVLAPLVTRILSVGVSIANKLMPALLPFARVAGDVLLKVAQNVDKFVSSPGFNNFLNQLLKLSGPALTSIFEGLGKIAVAVGKLLIAMSAPDSIRMMTGLLDLLAGAITLLAKAFNFATPRLAAFFRNVAQWTRDGKSDFEIFSAAVNAVLRNITPDINAVQGMFHQFFVVDIPHWIQDALNFFKKWPGEILGALGNPTQLLQQYGQQIVQGFINGVESMFGTAMAAIQNFFSGLINQAKSALGIHSPSTVFYGIGMDTMQGLADGLQGGWGSVARQLDIIGVNIGDRLADSLSSSKDKVADAAEKKIAQIIRQRIQAFRQFASGIDSNLLSWASITGAATGPAFTALAHGRGAAGLVGPYSHIAPGQPGAVSTSPPPITGRTLLTNLKLDESRLKKFAGAIKRLRHLGLDNTLLQQIIAAGPDQGYAIAEAILDAGKGEVFHLNQTESQISHFARQIGLQGAASQYAGGNVVINIHGFMNADKRQLAQQIQKLLAELKRHNGGAALGIA